MYVLVTCKSHKDPIKNEGATSVRNIFSGAQGYLPVRNSEVNRWMWSEFELIWDFMAILVNCKFEHVQIKHEGAIVSTTFSPL